MKTTIGFIGTGLMGSPMAVNLAKAGFDIKVWNRTPEKTQPAVEAGARRVDTAEEAAKGSRAVIFMLQDGAAVTDQLASSRLLKTCAPGTLIIDMSSISPIVAQDHAAIAQVLLVPPQDRLRRP